eukprot:6475344-Amphidinium_carterae.1
MKNQCFNCQVEVTSLEDGQAFQMGLSRVFPSAHTHTKKKTTTLTRASIVKLKSQDGQAFQMGLSRVFPKTHTHTNPAPSHHIGVVGRVVHALRVKGVPCRASRRAL